MANGLDYYTQPSNIMPGLEILGQGIQRRRAETKDAQQKQKQLDIRNRLAELMDKGTVNEIHQFLIQNPGASEVLEGITKTMDNREKQSLLSAARRTLILGENPAEVLQDVAKEKISQGIDATSTLKDIEQAIRNPRMSIQQAEKALAILDPTASKALQAQNAGGLAKPTANIQDFKFYQSLLKKDPKQAEMFARQVGITEEEKQKIKPTTAQQNFKEYMSMPDGAEKENFGRLIGIKPKETPKQALQRIEKNEQIQTEILGAETTINLVKKILNTPDYINNLSGISGRIFSIPGSQAYDSEVIFEQLESSLTLDNLDKMKGVLTDKDIQVLRSAAAGLKKGMSKKAMVNRLKKIQDVLQDKIKVKKKAIEPIENQQQTQRFKEGQRAIGPGGKTIIFQGGVWRDL